MTKATVARKHGPAQIPLVILPEGKVQWLDKATKRETIEQFYARSQWAEMGLPIICVDYSLPTPKPILRKDNGWKRRIKKSDDIRFITVPLGGGQGGGGSKQVGAIVAMVALLVVSTLIAGPYGAAAVGSVVGAQILGALVMAGGSYLISHFLSANSGAKTPKQDDVYSVSLSGNQAKPQGIIPVAYGRQKRTPDMAGAGFSTYLDNKQTYHGLYCLGVGDFDIEEIGINTTPLWTAADGYVSPSDSLKIEIVPPGQPVTSYPTGVTVCGDVGGQELPDPYSATNIGPGGETSGIAWVGPFALNPPATSANRICLNFIFGSGCFAQGKKGETQIATRHVVAEYRLINDAGAPISGASWVRFFDKNYGLATRVAHRLTEYVDAPTGGRFQIRTGCVDAKITENGTNAIQWSAAWAFIGAPSTFPRVTTFAIQIAADQRFSAFNSQQVYVIATRKLPVWNGTAFVTQATRNPIWAALDIWTNTYYGAAQSTAQIDLTKFLAYATAADARGDTFDYAFTSAATVYEMLETCLRPMLAQPLVAYDKLDILRDEQRLIPSVVFTDHNILPDSLRIRYHMSDAIPPDGVILEYVDEETWDRAEVGSIADSSTLAHPARVQIPGIVKRPKATQIARHMYAVNRYRRITATYATELEGLLLSRGNLVHVTSELPNSWGQSNQIDRHDIATRKIRLIAPAEWTDGAVHYLKITTPKGGLFGPVAVARGESDFDLIIDASDLAVYEAASGMTLTQALAREQGSERPAVSFAPAEPRCFKGLVTNIRPSGDNGFEITLVNDAPEVYDVDDSDVPPAPTPSELTLPLIPAAIGDIKASLSQNVTELVLSASWSPSPGSATYIGQISNDDGESWVTVYNGQEPSFRKAGFGDNDIKLKIYGVSATGRPGASSVIDVTTPGINLQPKFLGYEILPNDLSSGAIDEVLAGGVVVAEAGTGAPNAKITIGAGSTTSGGAAAIELKVSTPSITVPVSAGMRLELFETSTGSGIYNARVVFNASSFYIVDSTLQKVPFAIEGGELRLQGVTRLSDILRSDSVDANGVPLWSIDPDGVAKFINGEFSGLLKAAKLAVGQDLELGIGSRIRRGQLPMSATHSMVDYWFMYNSGFFANPELYKIYIDEFRAYMDATRPTFLDDNRSPSTPIYLTTSGNVYLWMMPDGSIRGTSGQYTPATTGSTRYGGAHPAMWDPYFIQQPGWPKKHILWAVGHDVPIRVPTGAVRMSFKMVGAGGGRAAGSSYAGGSGGFVSGEIAVTAGENLMFQVGLGGAWGNFQNQVYSSPYYYPKSQHRRYAGQGVTTYGNPGGGYLSNVGASGGGRCKIAKVDAYGAETIIAIAGGGGSASTSASGTPGGPASSSTGGNGSGNGTDGTGAGQGSGGGGYDCGSLTKGGTNYLHASVTSGVSTAGSAHVPPNTSDSDFVAYLANLGLSAVTDAAPGYGCSSARSPYGPDVAFAKDSHGSGVGAPGCIVVTFYNT